MGSRRPGSDGPQLRPQHSERQADAHYHGRLAEFERDLIRDRVKSGLAAARARGVKLGRQVSQRGFHRIPQLIMCCSITLTPKSHRMVFNAR